MSMRDPASRPVRAVFLLLVAMGLVLSSQLVFPRTWTSADNLPGGTPDVAGNPPFNRNCSVSSCHNSDEAGTVKVLKDEGGFPAIPTSYTPGQTYNWVVEVANTDASFQRWGYELTIMWDTADPGYVNRTAGTLSAVDNFSNVKPGATFGNPTVPDPSRHFLTHYGVRKDDPHVDGTYGGTGSPARWKFKWVAPLTTGYSVKVYVTGVAATNDSAAANDVPYVNTYTLTEASSPTATHNPSWGRIKTLWR